MIKTIKKQAKLVLFYRFYKNEYGTTSIEYAIIGSLISVGIIAALITYTDSASTMYNMISTTVATAVR
jgi:Flp pilus assembly pilin Flp